MNVNKENIIVFCFFDVVFNILKVDWVNIIVIIRIVFIIIFINIDLVIILECLFIGFFFNI